MTLYSWVKYAHILMAITAVGFNASYGIWLARAAREPDHLSHVLRGIKILDDRFANPAYGILLLTGLWMVIISPWELTTFWIASALVLGHLAKAARELPAQWPRVRAQSRPRCTRDPSAPRRSQRRTLWRTRR
jgi:uncharacterized membrane protein